MLSFTKNKKELFITYYPDNPWVVAKIKSGDEIPLKKRTFIFTTSDVYSSDVDGNESEFVFTLGKLVNGNYYLIEGRVLDISQNVYIHKDIELSEKSFIGVTGFAIFKKVSNVISEDIYIGGDHPTALPSAEFSQLLKEFPNPYEISKYVDARLASVLSNYYESVSGVQEKHTRYLNKKLSTQGKNLTKELKNNEVNKYETVLEKLTNMLANEDSYNEKQWQREIIQIILLLYPKYIYCFEEAIVRDSYKKTDRKIDFLLVDSNGNVDIIEIKRPFGEKIITKGVYRDNHIPMRELSGTVMQIEKYIFHLNKSGMRGEDRLARQYVGKLPNDFKIKITNPSGMIIMGREKGLSTTQKEDFEVVKRKYKNLIDIISYDDLLQRLKNMITAWKSK